MEAYKVEVVLKQSGTLVLEELPFQVGEQVEVIVVRVSDPVQKISAETLPLQGTVLRYDAPFDPVAESEWEALE
ncbi:MAG: hypothetical protein JW981_04310 [Anaerolineae bacterium]|nr:hypothetical protein [Anaerolineae bacterium]